MTDANATTVKRLRIDPGIDPALTAWALKHTVPGGAFLTLGHAMEVGIARILEERDFIKRTCRAERVPYDDAAFWSIRSDLLRRSVPNPKAPPRRHGEPTHRTLQRVFVSIAEALIEQVRALAEPAGPFSSANPTAHAVEFGLLVLREADAGKAIAGAAFPFDGSALWKRYLAAVKARR